MLTIYKKGVNKLAIEFCEDFARIQPEKRFLFGRNEYAEGIASLIEIGAFIDDFATELTWNGKPVIKKEEVPQDGLVVSTLLGRPLTARKVLSDARLRHIDYFTFYKYCGLDLPPVRFWSLFEEDFENHKDKYIWIGELLKDEESREAYNKIVNFRLSGDLSYMEDFTDRQKEQYFEEFLYLKEKDESFVDAGGFDGFTSMEFIKRCPGYRSVYIFEPESKNMEVAKARLANFTNVHFMPYGLSNKKGTVKFSIGGSCSAIREDGEFEIPVDALDHIVHDYITFIKMDIEGAEGLAIEGARKTILNSHPRLAISVYHKCDDLWRIPEQILSIRKDYDLYLRHYTEGVVETVMFFIPKN
jgi:FkbM family methyltransferase